MLNQYTFRLRESVSLSSKKVILATAEKVVMGDSLDDALYMLTGDSYQITNQNRSESPPSTEKKDSNNISIGNATSQDVNKSIQRLRQELDALEDLIQKLNKEQKGD